MPEIDSTLNAAAPDLACGDGPGLMSGLKFRLIVLQHHRSAYHLALSLLKDMHEAEDATQEAFERLWRHRAKVERPREWLMRVTRNACLDRLRQVGRTVRDADALVPEGREERGPAWHFEQAELATKLGSAIEALPEPHRSLVLLFDVQGMSGAECARILELSGDQVKVYLHRARRRLRDILEKGGV